MALMGHRHSQHGKISLTVRVQTSPRTQNPCTKCLGPSLAVLTGKQNPSMLRPGRRCPVTKLCPGARQRPLASSSFTSQKLEAEWLCPDLSLPRCTRQAQGKGAEGPGVRPPQRGTTQTFLLVSQLAWGFVTVPENSVTPACHHKHCLATLSLETWQVEPGLGGGRGSQS